MTNALRPQTTREMAQAIADVRRDDAVRCLVITGTGRGFCAGDDFQAIFLAEDRGSRRVERKIERIRHGEPSLDVISGSRRRPTPPSTTPASATAWTSPSPATSASPPSGPSWAGSSCAAA